ncbi:dodecin family protein [Natranaerofaba carboxydovora]|uniref:dodecin family protein n=1 Tax=Natranaerofaba carboxydovora TaxID=2742683 RepID=UPI001F12CADE|nr:dodecin family protein [Natranaerofaba carboxydovora]UMZ73917.1 Dodecin [Natranaerofaba carboxydovora]
MVETVKVVELVGESKQGWEDAVQNAVHEASKTIDDIAGVEIYNFTGDVEDGKIVEYKANVKVAFNVSR